MQEITGKSVQSSFADEDYAGEVAAAAVRYHGSDLQVIKLPETKKAFVLLPRR